MGCALSHMGPAGVPFVRVSPAPGIPGTGFQPHLCPLHTAWLQAERPPPEASLPHLSAFRNTLQSEQVSVPGSPEAEPETRVLCSGLLREAPAEGWSSAGWRSWLETALPDPARRPGPALRQGSTFCLLALASRWLWAVPAGKRGGRGWFPGEGAAVSISSQRRPQLGAGSTGWERGPETHPPPAQHGTRVTGRAHRSSPDRGFTKAKTSVIS